jgi:hypothetical protein
MLTSYVSIRQHTSAYARAIAADRCLLQHHLHTSAYVSIRQHTSAYVSIRQHTSAYASIRYGYATAMPPPAPPARG